MNLSRLVQTFADLIIRKSRSQSSNREGAIIVNKELTLFICQTISDKGFGEKNN